MNKWIKIGFIIVAVFVLGFFAVQTKNYFDSTYVGEDYYMQVPASQSTTIETWQDGQYTIRGKQYMFTAYNVVGNPKVVAFDITDFSDGVITEDELLQPHVYLKINASESRVISWEIIQVADVPEAARSAIQANH